MEASLTYPKNAPGHVRFFTKKLLWDYLEHKGFVVEKYISDEELYYIALSVEEIKSVRAKRTIFDMIHIQWDGDSITRFLSYFSEKNKEEIMYSC